jgi:hypothetical protein
MDVFVRGLAVLFRACTHKALPCPPSGVMRTRYARREVFSFRPTADMSRVEIPQCSGLPVCYRLGGSTGGGSAAPLPRFRTIQLWPKDLPRASATD